MQRLDVARLGHHEFVAQLFWRIPSIKIGRLQHGMLREVPLDPRRKDVASRLGLQVFVAADVICVGMGIVDRLQRPAVGFKMLSDLFARILVVAAVDQAHLLLPRLHQTDLRRALDVIAVSSHLDQFVHITPPVPACQACLLCLFADGDQLLQERVAFIGLRAAVFK